MDDDTYSLSGALDTNSGDNIYINMAFWTNQWWKISCGG